MNCVHDTKALELSREVMALMYGRMPTGGSVQLQAKIQCLFADAMDFAAGNSPVIPDGWVACSERMPELDTRVLLYFSDYGGHIEDGCIGEEGDGHYHYFFDGDSLRSEPTHWMPLPAAPKQEVKP